MADTSTITANQAAAAAPAMEAIVASLVHKQAVTSSKASAVEQAQHLAGAVRVGFGAGKVPAGFVSPNRMAALYVEANPAALASLWDRCSAPTDKRKMRIINNLADQICRTLENAGVVEAFNPDSAGYRKALAKKEGKPAPKAEKKSVAEAANAADDVYNKLTAFSVSDMLIACAARAEAEKAEMTADQQEAARLNALAVASHLAPRKAARR
jgi:hypothetical protein